MLTIRSSIYKVISSFYYRLLTWWASCPGIGTLCSSLWSRPDAAWWVTVTVRYITGVQNQFYRWVMRLLTLGDSGPSSPPPSRHGWIFFPNFSQFLSHFNPNLWKNIHASRSLASSILRPRSRESAATTPPSLTYSNPSTSLTSGAVLRLWKRSLISRKKTYLRS